MNAHNSDNFWCDVVMCYSYNTLSRHTEQELCDGSRLIVKRWTSETRLLVCFPDSGWRTEWRCRVASLRAAKRGRIPGTRWHLLRCKTLLLLSFMTLDLDHRGCAARGERRKRMREIIAHKDILLKTPQPPHLGGISLHSLSKYLCWKRFYLYFSLLCFHLTRPCRQLSSECLDDHTKNTKNVIWANLIWFHFARLKYSTVIRAS